MKALATLSMRIWIEFISRAVNHLQSQPTLFLLEERARQAGLAKDAQQSPAADGIVKRNRNSNRGVFGLPLQDAVAPALAHQNKSVPFKNSADLRAREDPKPTQRAPQPE
jgi:hypothetical protein